ncbi:MAG TPA: hypothetical protein VMU19_03025 [Bryobacteraceae bacterium]|nr:hypothetical protein [Bryobacteraceae bacterium]
MSQHLSERQIAEWSLGGRDPEVDRHVAYCAACRAELERTGSALAAFRESARQWSAREMERVPHTGWRAQDPPRWNAFRALRWACAMAVLAVCAGVSTMAWRSHQAPAQDSAAADAMLLKQIDADVSQTVPDSMEPLVKLVSWDGTGAAARN